VYGFNVLVYWIALPFICYVICDIGCVVLQAFLKHNPKYIDKQIAIAVARLTEDQQPAIEALRKEVQAFGDPPRPTKPRDPFARDSNHWAETNRVDPIANILKLVFLPLEMLSVWTQG